MWNLIRLVMDFFKKLWGWHSQRQAEQELQITQAAAEIAQQQKQDLRELEEKESEREREIQRQQAEVEGHFTTDQDGAAATADSLNDFFGTSKRVRPQNFRPDDQ